MGDRLPSWREVVLSAPRNWREGCFGDLLDLRNETGVPHLPLLAVTRERGVIDRELVEKRDTSSDDKSKYKRVLEGDIVYNTMRMWQGVSGLAQQEGLVSPAYTVTPPREGADGRFLAYLLKYPPLVRVFRAFSQGLVDDTLSLRYPELARIPVRVPPLPEQRKIAAILSAVDDAIEKTQAVIEQVQVVKKGLMQELLTRGLPGRHTKFKQTEIGEVPDEWEVLRLQSLGGSAGRPVLRTGPFGSSLKTEHFKKSGTPVLNIQCLGDGEISKEGLFYVDDRKAEELTEYRVAEGDLVFSRVADVGRSVVVPQESQGWIISSNLMRISPDPKIVDPHFLMYSIVGSRAVMRQIQGFTAKGGRAVVSSPILMGLLFPIPPLVEQRVIASALNAMEQRARSEASYADRLAAVKQALMSVLLTGEVRVTPTSEAA